MRFSFRGVERSVDFLLSPRLGQAYQHVKEHGANLPLVGRAVFLPSVEAAEGVTRFFLVVVQAPLPSAESVASVAEVCTYFYDGKIIYVHMTARIMQ